MASRLLDVTLEVEPPRDASEVLESLPQLTVLDVRSSRGGLVSHLLAYPSHEHVRVKEALTKLGFEVVAEGVHDGRRALMVRRRCTVCRALLSHGAFVLSGSIGGSRRAEFRFLVDPAGLKRLLRRLERLGVSFSVKRLKACRLEASLTEVQEQALMDALREGFFDYPRRIGLSELARKLGVAPSTLSEVLRRGLRRVLEDYFNHRSSTTAA